MYTAILLKTKERPHDLVAEVIKEAGRLERKFKKFTVLGKLDLGSKSYLRVKCVDNKLSDLLVGLGRDHLKLNAQGSYSLHSNPEKIIGAHLIHAVPDNNMKKVYVGPGGEFWERQF